MKSLKEVWTIRELIDQRNVINPRPQFQRTLVWNTDKKQKLIDSILRGYDLPKFYLRGMAQNQKYKFDVTDGQQRIHAIWEFFDGKLSLPKKTLINNDNLSGLKYDELPQKYKNAFDNYELHITNLYESTTYELNDLFARLQAGVSLIPVELRHATLSNIGKEVNKILNKHKFFEIEKGKNYFVSRIPDRRFKHQDYLDHVLALSFYNNGKPDLKAKTLMQFYTDLSDVKYNEIEDLLKNTHIVLDKMYEINEHHKGLFKNKWGFVDTFWLFFKKIDLLKNIDSKKFAKKFAEFETKRKKYSSEPDQIIQSDKDLYDYIIAFSKDGAKRDNIQKRHEVFSRYFFT